MNRTLVVLSGLLCSATLQMSAQTAASSPRPTPPPGPLIQTRAPNMSQWVISTKVAPASTGTSAALPENANKGAAKYVVVTKTGNIINTLIVHEDRNVWSVWNDGALHMVVSPDGKQVGEAVRPLDPDAANPYYFDYSQTDFPGFEWMTLDSYQDLKTYQGRQVLIFMKGAGQIAYIDEETRLPLLLVDTEGIHFYAFRTPPAAMLKLPDNVQQYLLDQERHEESLANKKIAPF
jgi:hypothetical protein